MRRLRPEPWSRPSGASKTFYTCGSYKRYGASVCSKHYIAHDVLAQVVLNDLNRLIDGVENLRQLAQQGSGETSAFRR